MYGFRVGKGRSRLGWDCECDSQSVVVLTWFIQAVVGCLSVSCWFDWFIYTVTRSGTNWYSKSMKFMAPCRFIVVVHIITQGPLVINSVAWSDIDFSGLIPGCF